MRAGIPDGEGRDEALAATCHACGRSGLEAFFAMDDVPAHSCVVTATAAEALQVPRGRILLAVCGDCGFVQNVRFDPTLVDYSRPYEESQAASPRFVSFAEALAKRLVADHALVGATAVDIGSGKGDFLRRLVDAGISSATGVDPSVRPERVPAGYEDHIRLVPEFFETADHMEPADLVCCRHTLEHIAPVAEFTEQLVELVRRRDASTLFIEVPDVGRVLTEGAFWDVYHEHCSYFTPGSLARMLRRLGLDVVFLGLEFDDQYVVADAVVGSSSATATPIGPVEEDAAEVVAAARRFAANTDRAIARWQRFLRDGATARETTVLWGGGSKAVAFLTATDAADAIDAVVDISPHRQGIHLPPTGHRVVAPEELPAVEPDHVVVMNPIYREEIMGTLAALGLQPRIHTL